MTQADMLDASPAASDNILVGVSVTMPAACPRCRGTSATVGAGRGPHAASIMCACSRHLGWMSRESFDFITETVRQFGRPTSPIQIRGNTPRN